MCEYVPDKNKVKELVDKILSIVNGEVKMDILYALAGAEVVVHSESLEHCIKATGNKAVCIAGFINTSAELYARMIASVLINVLGIENIKKLDAITI